MLHLQFRQGQLSLPHVYLCSGHKDLNCIMITQWPTCQMDQALPAGLGCAVFPLPFLSAGGGQRQHREHCSFEVLQLPWAHKLLFPINCRGGMYEAVAYWQ